jgi:RHS repeat-associated protein
VPALGPVADAINSVAAPFQQGPDTRGMDIPEAALLWTAHAIKAGTGVLGAAAGIIDGGVASLGQAISDLTGISYPAMPAVTILSLHVGPPHAHPHPPSFGVPLPSLGQVVGPGSVTVLLGGLPAARCGDFGLAPTCGGYAPPFDIVTGSSSVFIGGKRAARMGDLTRHCNPVEPPVPGAKPPSMLERAGGAMGMVGLAGGAAAAALGQPWALAQAAADLAAEVAKSFIGKDPGAPPLYGVLVGPPLANVQIGGFPCPDIGGFAGKAINKGISKALKAVGGKVKGTAGKLRARMQRKKSSGSEPIYLVTGEVYTDHVDYAPGILFEWRWRYTSARCALDGPLGHGFKHCYERRLERRLHRATFHDWDGVSIDFTRFELGQDTTRAQGYVLRRLRPGHFRVSTRGQPDFEFSGGEFDSELPLTRVSNEKADLDLEYDELGRLVALVQTPRDPAEGRRRYELRLDEANHVAAVVEMDPALSNGSSQRDPSRGALRASFEYSKAGDMVRARDSFGGSWSAEYDALHRLSRQTDARGYSYDYRYDASDRCIASSGQDGLWRCKVEYHSEANFTRYTEGEGATWEFHYDDSGVVTKIVDPYGGEEKRRLDEHGRIVSEVDSGGRELCWLYDENGAHHARVDRFGNLFLPEEEEPLRPNPFARELPRDTLGFLLGGRIERNADAMLGLYGATLAPLPPDVVRSAQHCFRFRTSSSDRDPETPSEVIRPEAPRVTFDRLGRKVREEDALGRVRGWQYDPCGNLVGETDRDGRQTTWEVTSWNLVGTRSDAMGHGVRYEYSPYERTTAIIDPAGNESRYDYDLKNRLVRVHRHGRVREEYIYDSGDHFIQKRDGDGNVLFDNSFHANHLVAKRQLTSGGHHQLAYDSRGRITEASTEAHRVLVAYGPNGQRLRELRDGRGVEHRHMVAEVTTKVLGEYEQHESWRRDGLLTAPTGKTTRLEWRDAGLIQRQCANGTSELLQFDDEGRLEASLRYRRGRFGNTTAESIRYRYSAEGDLLESHDSERGISRYGVDTAHRLDIVRTPQGSEHTYRLDPAGNLRAHPETGNIVVAAGNLLDASTEETFRYDRRNHLGARTSRRDQSSIHYHYDSFDMLVRIEREHADLPKLDHHLTADLPERSAAYDHPDALPHCTAWTAAYDALGRRLWSEWTSHDGMRLRRELYWDGDRIAAEIMPTGRLRIYQYASQTALVPLQFTDYASTTSPAASGKTYHVFSNQTGLPLCIEDEQGRIVWWVERADPYGWLHLRPRQNIDYAHPGASIEYNLRWPGHYFDPETCLHYNRYRYYDPRLGRYLQCDPLGHEGSPINLYAYCPNPLVQVDVLGLDHEGKVASSKESGDVDGQEGTAPGKAPPAPPPHHILAAENVDTPAHRAARDQVAREFFDSNGMAADYPSARNGIDMTKPVRIVNYPPPSQVNQYVRNPSPTHPKPKLGNWVDPKGGQSGDELGLNTDPAFRTPATANVPPRADGTPRQALESTAAPIVDKWTDKANPLPTKGGGTQWTITPNDRADLVAVNPGYI